MFSDTYQFIESRAIHYRLNSTAAVSGSLEMYCRSFDFRLVKKNLLSFHFVFYSFRFEILLVAIGLAIQEIPWNKYFYSRVTSVIFLQDLLHCGLSYPCSNQIIKYHLNPVHTMYRNLERIISNPHPLLKQ